MSNSTPTRPPVMTLTDAAAQRVSAMMVKKPDVIGLRLSVKNGGCAGMEYAMDWATERGPADEQVDAKGATILIDPMAIMYLLGTQMDYKVDKLSTGFVFNNPNQQSACGCGESVELVAASQEKIDALKQD